MTNIDELRYFLTNHKEKIFISKYENYMLLIYPTISNQNDLVRRVFDDIELMPSINSTKDDVVIKFYRFDYNSNLFNKSELLAFIFAYINKDWNVIKGVNLFSGRIHFWLKNGNVVFDPSLSIITKESVYSIKFKDLMEIKNDDIASYLINNNNLTKFYKKGFFYKYPNDFSTQFLNDILKRFNLNVEKQYVLDADSINYLKEHFMLDDFLKLRQVLTHKRKSFLESDNIAVSPLLDDSILNDIDKISKCVCDLLKSEYSMSISYYVNTIGKCYALSILFHLFDGSFNLVQGGIPYKRQIFNIVENHFYQHSWLEKDNFVYDPALRIVVPKDLYYIFVHKQDVYTQEDTKNILRRIGFNLTHFRDFMNGVQIGNEESIMYRSLIKKIDSIEFRESGEKLLSLVQSYKG